MDKEYLYYCAGCKKPDKEYPDEETECDDCEGSGYIDDCNDAVEMEDENYCWKCTGYGKYTLRCRPIAHHRWAKVDAYGIYTGLYCDKCYADPQKYTYRKDRYHDEAYCGERMNPDE